MSIIAKNVGKSFGVPPTQVLFDLSFEIEQGEFLAITGKSGSGKSTLLYVLSTLDHASQGEIEVDGQNVSGLTELELDRFRNEQVGFVFQFHYLLPELTALENVLMPAMKADRGEELKPYAVELLNEFGLGDKHHRLPSQLSGGEQQRVAIARALVMRPKILFADEPTGNLDSANGEVVMKIFERVNREHRTTVIYVTHDPDFAARAQRQIVLIDGRMATEGAAR